MSCQEASPTRDITVGDSGTILVDPQSELLTQPSGLAVGPDGAVYVTDYALGRLIRTAGRGAKTVVLAHKGGGPGELQSPTALAVHGDTVRVVDSGNGRVHVFTLDGHYVRSYGAGHVTTAGRFDIAPSGRIAMATQGLRGGALVTVLDAEGRELQNVGPLVVPSSEGWDVAAIKNAVAGRRVPDVFRNTVLPRFAPDGRLWIVHLAEPLVEQYDTTGRRWLNVKIAFASMESILGAFFERNAREALPYAFYPLQYFSDAAAVGDDLWLLTNQSDGEPREVLILDRRGKVRERLVFPRILDARRLAVDHGRTRVYFLSGALGTVLAVALPH